MTKNTNSIDEHIISPAATFRALTRIESKQDLILEKQNDLKKDHDDLKTRMSAVETRQNRVAGGLTVLVFIVTLFGSKIREVIFG